jgi:2-C-methyl-D-erythritol 4-phosphate cytidylyltransferase
MPVFSVILVTAPPVGMAGEAGGAFVKIDGREALLRSVELFLNRDLIKQIQIVFTAETVEEAKRKHGGHFGFSGVKVLTGGPKWGDQLAVAAQHLLPEITHVVVHDAARPAVPYSDIDQLLTDAEHHPIVSLVTPVRAPLVEVDPGASPVAYHLPGDFRQIVTPQSFARAKFDEITKSRQEPHASQLTLLNGSPLNVRIGSGADASFAKAMIQMLPRPKLKAPSSPFEEAQW